jgi:hypothetical protein
MFEFIILGLWLCIAIVLHIQIDIAKNGAPLIAKSLTLSEEEISVRKISILGNNLFQIVLDEDSSLKTIIGKIDCDRINCEDADLKQLLRKISSPKVVLVHKQDEVWLLKINFILEGKRMSLRKWLDSQNLVSK